MKKILSILLSLSICAGICGAVSEPEDEHSLPDEPVKIPIIMYHMISKSPRGDDYTITPQMLEDDLEYLEKCGRTTITVADLIAFVYDGAPLPENPVMISIDDGDYAVYKYAYPLLKEHNMKAVAAIIGNITDKYTAEGREDINYPNLVWPQIIEMYDSGAIEFQNHSYNLHKIENGFKGASKRKGEDFDCYSERLRDDVELLQDRMDEVLGYRPTAFVYPFGFACDDSETILKSLGFKASLGCAEGVSKVEYGEPDSLFCMKRYNRAPKYSQESFFKKMGIETNH